jgi:hypothetical protein
VLMAHCLDLGDLVCALLHFLPRYADVGRRSPCHADVGAEIPVSGFFDAAASVDSGAEGVLADT